MKGKIEGASLIKGWFKKSKAISSLYKIHEAQQKVVKLQKFKLSVSALKNKYCDFIFIKQQLKRYATKITEIKFGKSAIVI